jgi:hypothetical protein
MLTKHQRILLQNVLDALDRLFDRASTATDVHALLFATASVLASTPLCHPFEAPIRELEKVIRSKALPDHTRVSAMEVTDALRKFVAEELQRDAAENPRQRHIA